MKNKTLMSIITLGMILSLAGYGINEVSANDTYPPIVSAIASKFNLNEDEVEAVFDAVREEHQTEMQEERKARLDQAVSDGVITTEQKDALLAKIEERKENRAANREEMQEWFDSVGIDHEALRAYMGPKNGYRKQFREMD